MTAFTLEDFRVQLVAATRPGLVQKMLLHMPGMGQTREILESPGLLNDIRRQIAIIDSMTLEERRNRKLLNEGRNTRIALGAGVPTSEIRQLLKTFDVMAPMINQPPGNDVHLRGSSGL